MYNVNDTKDSITLSPSQLTAQIKKLFEKSFNSIRLRGEISNFKPASSGHWYFSIIDSQAMVTAVMFKGRNCTVSFNPKDGMDVELSGTLMVYEKKGNYQIVCESLKLVGTGTILQMLEQRKQEYLQLGYFDSNKKKALPIFIKTLAIITSPTGAAIQDILNVMRRRTPWIKIIIIPVPVQGDTAADKISAGINLANKFNLGEVILLARGGGSTEDLLPFSEKSVVQAIYDSCIPVISAVGHEIDFSLADFVADLRAPTPSAGAEILSIDYMRFLQMIIGPSKVLISKVLSLKKIMHKAINPFSSEIMNVNIRKLLHPHYQRLDDAKEDLLTSLANKIESNKHRVQIASQILENCSPFNVLSRGYAIIRNAETKSAYNSAKEIVSPGSVLIQMKDDTILATIKNKQG